MSCPNSTASGCRCAEHHPGLGYTPDNATAVLRVLTPGPQSPAAPRDAGDTLLRNARAICTACNGNPAICQDGTGAPRYERLPGCNAWANDGQLAAIKAPPAPLQPWMPRPARHAA